MHWYLQNVLSLEFLPKFQCTLLCKHSLLLRSREYRSLAVIRPYSQIHSPQKYSKSQFIIVLKINFQKSAKPLKKNRFQIKHPWSHFRETTVYIFSYNEYAGTNHYFLIWFLHLEHNFELIKSLNVWKLCLLFSGRVLKSKL